MKSQITLAKVEASLIKQATLKHENNNRIKEISKLAKKFGFSGSTLALKPILESCKQGKTETVQNFSLCFRKITNEPNYSSLVDSLLVPTADIASARNHM